MRTPNIGKQHLRAVLTQRSQRDHLMQVEIDWPGSRGLLERLAVGLGGCYATQPELRERLSRIVTSAIATHRAAKEAHWPDRERFAAFIAGMTAVLRPAEHAALAFALTQAQRRILGGQLRAVATTTRRGAVDA
ncbi:hypothetical protein [Lamprocystis purpurea]|jgi:hypothetical protein|uniref:hypothetical protein n=1 Tax=Lamprocystis purpurea TaxID=61598 RepID=UPI0003603D29|nr:hypothetical protein [Lamprocystis purpurea]